jgi:hypothetical protein
MIKEAQSPKSVINQLAKAMINCKQKLRRLLLPLLNPNSIIERLNPNYAITNYCLVNTSHEFYRLSPSHESQMSNLSYDIAIITNLSKFAQQ